MKFKKKPVIFISLLVSGFALDILTKIWANSTLKQEFINPDKQSHFSFNFTLAYNKGAAFGMLNSVSGGRWILTVVGILALFAIYYFYKRPESKSRLYLIGLALVAGGALGNLVDRIFMGKVTDFIQFWGTPSIKTTWPWPTFNVADIILVVGVGLMLIYSFIPQPEFEKKSKKGSKKGKKGSKKSKSEEPV